MALNAFQCETPEWPFEPECISGLGRGSAKRFGECVFRLLATQFGRTTGAGICLRTKTAITQTIVRPPGMQRLC